MEKLFEELKKVQARLSEINSLAKDEENRSLTEEEQKEWDELIVKAVDGKNETTHCIRTVHAEINAILQAARFGVSVEYGTMYCTMFPCYDCAKAIINVGIRKVVSLCDYQDSARSKDILASVGVDWSIRDERTIQYE